MLSIMRISGGLRTFAADIKREVVLFPRVLEAFCLKHAVCRRQKEKSPE